MTQHTLTRRRLLFVGAGLAGLSVAPALAATGATPLHVLKDPDCSCCGAWIAIVAAEGFAVTTDFASAADLQGYKRANGIPEAMASCHTARVEGYMVEGHVPVADIRRLLAERPDAIGLAVPGMPWGSPGMGPETEREGYDVSLIHRDGSTSVFSHYAAA
jgi:hypothetical protein